MLLLRPPSWADEFSSSPSSAAATASSSFSSPSSSSSSSSSSFPPSSSSVSGLVACLIDRRLYREVALSLRTSLADAYAPFSFLRVRGLKLILKFLSLAATSESLIRLFQESQTDPGLQVVPVLFGHSLRPSKGWQSLPDDPIPSEEPPEVSSPPTEHEIALALRVLEGCCLLDKASRLLASNYTAVKEVIELLSVGGTVEQGACLDALPALLLDTPKNQQDFARHQGLVKIAEFVRDEHTDQKMRIKCAEFLLLLVGSLLPQCDVEEGNEEQFCVEDAQQDLLELLGFDFMAVINEVDEIVSSYDLDTPRKKEDALHYHAESLLDLIDSTIL